MRVLLFTGKGGVGTTTVAAASAVRAARDGIKTLLISADPAHPVSASFGANVGRTPTELDTGLAAMQIDAQAGLEDGWRETRDGLLALFDSGGIDPIEAEEVTVLPGSGELLTLLAVAEQAERGPWDLIVVDCPPAQQTLRLLALPDTLDWYLRRLWPVHRRLARALRPVANRMSPVPLAGEALADAVTRLAGRLDAVRALLRDRERTSVRLVLTPDSAAVADARRTFTALALDGYRVDGVIANRVFPAAQSSADPWRAGWARAQETQLDAVRAAFAPLPILQLEYAPAEPVGLDALSAAGRRLYDLCRDARVAPGEGEPAGPGSRGVTRTDTGFTLTLELPFVERDEIALTRRGDELALTVAGRRRLLTLPSVLRRCVVTGAELRDGKLDIAFVPDPDLWMQG